MTFASRAYRVGEAALIAALGIATIVEIGNSLVWAPRIWNITEWLIDYSGGFVRRGLGGALIEFVTAATGIRPEWVVIIVSVIAYPPVLLWFLTALRRNFSRPILLSSAALGMPAFSSFLVRKDLFETALFILLLLALRPGPHRSARLVACWALSVIGILIHENFALAALPAAALIAFRRETGRNPLRAAVLAVAPGLLTFLLVVVYQGDAATANAISHHWDPLWPRLDNVNCHYREPVAAIGALNWSAARALRPVAMIFSSFSYHIYVPIAWLITGFAVFALLMLGARLGSDAADPTEPSDATPRMLGNVMVWQAVCVAPLFVVGEDYGRWIFLWSSSSLALIGAGHAGYFPETRLWTCRWLRVFVERMARHRTLLPFALLLFATPAYEWKVQTYAARTPGHTLAHLARFALGKTTFYEIAYRCAPSVPIREPIPPHSD